MRYAWKVGGVLFGMVLVLSATYASSVGAAHLTSPSFQLDTNLGGSFGGAISSPSYKMTSIGGEAVVGNGTSGSYILDQRFDSAVPSIQITTQPSGLVGYYPFDENTGATAYDNSSYSATGTVTGTPAWTAGKLGSALQFNGTSQYVALGSPAQLQLTSGTMSAWIKTTATSGTMAVVAKPSNFLLEINANKVATYDWNTSTTCQEPTTGVADGSWHYIAVTFQSGVAGGSKLYKDGVVVNGSCTVTIPGTSTGVFIGQSGTSSQYFNGSIDNVKIFSSVLDSSAIMAEYSAQNNDISAGLSLHTIAPGSSNTTTFDTIVTTNSPYSVSVSQDHDLQIPPAGVTIPAVSGSIASPTAWSESITNGLGFSLVSAPSLDSKWGSGANFAAFPSSATTFYSRPSNNAPTKDVIAMKARLDTSQSQLTGNYSNTITITGTTLP